VSLHHVRLIHGSETYRAAHQRVGFVVRDIAADVRQLTGIPDSATLVRGQDRYGNFMHEPRLASGFHPDTVAFHPKICDSQTNILYAAATAQPDREAGGKCSA
jgi:hypothetical protein